MKLKEFLGIENIEDKTITLLKQGLSDETINLVKKDIVDCIVYEKNKGFKLRIPEPLGEAAPYTIAALIAGGLSLLKKRDKEYYNKLYQEIINNKEEAEIDEKRISKAFPELKIFMQVTKLYAHSEG